MSKELTGYELSRSWFDFCFENPEKVSPNHSAIFFFAIEHCNRLGWKNKFGFPTQMAMDAIGIKKHQTYIRYFNDLCEWEFFTLVEKSVNQYSANIISLSFGMLKNGKALDKAIITHAAKQIEPIGQSNGQSNSSIDKPITNNQITNNKEDKENLKNKKEVFNQMPLPENIFELPAMKIGSAKQLLKITKQVDVSDENLIGMWEVFKIQNLTGKKFYKDLEAVHSHFINWIKTQNFEHGNNETKVRSVGKSIEFDAA